MHATPADFRRSRFLLQYRSPGSTDLRAKPERSRKSLKGTESMNINKRGDHLFAAGLWKAIGDVAKSVRTQIGQYSEGRVLANALLEFQRDLGGSEFDITINQGRLVTGSDAHSLVFGQPFAVSGRTWKRWCSRSSTGAASMNAIRACAPKR